MAYPGIFSHSRQLVSLTYLFVLMPDDVNYTYFVFVARFINEH